MKHLIRITSALLLFFSLPACQKQAGEELKTQLLTERKWRLVKYEMRADNDPWVDLFPGRDDCDKDDITEFKVNNTYEINGGDKKCDHSEPAIVDNGEWRFTANGTKMYFEGHSDLHDIEELNENRLMISISKEINPGSTESVRSTYGH